MTKSAKKKSPNDDKKILKALLISHDLGDYFKIFEHHFKNTDGIIKVMKYDKKNKTERFFNLMYGSYDVPIVDLLDLEKYLLGE